LLIWTLQQLPPAASGLSVPVRESLPLSGVRAEVTAVLLNFRGYDTLLELAVLLAAVLGVWQAGRVELVHYYRQPSPVLDTLIRLLVPITVVVTGYVLWLSSHAAGGAFQAGALLAGAGVLQDRAGIRALLVVGPAVFALVAGTLLFIEGTLLQYPPASAGGLILLIEAVSVISIGLILTLLFVGGRPPGGDRP
jgi:multisubunit Na+/H+ antiporter MnhB subunit